MRYFFIVFFISLSPLIFSQSSKNTCIDCHGDSTLTEQKNSKEISLFVDINKFDKSVHKDLDCKDCHVGFNPEEIPHKKGENISKVDCSQCHDIEKYSKSIHGIKKVECFSCHTKHDIQPAKVLVKNEAKFCLVCHTSPFVIDYKKSVHYKYFLKGENAPNCTDCHNKSAHAIELVNLNKAVMEHLCSTCHKKSENEFTQSIHNLAKANGTPGCINCHGAHDVYYSKYSISSKACLTCHLKTAVFIAAGKPKLVDFVKSYETSVHARIGRNGTEAATCVDCHGNHMIMGTKESRSRISRENIPTTCGSCHSKILSAYKSSAHGIAFYSGVTIAPNCINCHGEHNIKSIEKTPESKLNELKICFKCHVDNINVIKLAGESKQGILGYENSVHYQALVNGNENAPTCSDCHGSHSMQSTNVPSSRIYKKNIANTCGDGSSCHPVIAKQYKESIHAHAIEKGIMAAPTCINCHGNHQIYAPSNPKSSVATREDVVLLCSSCHGDVKMISKYGVPTNRISSYNASYHGLAVKGGSLYAADCASCHGAHAIEPSSDPTSSINPKNLSKTCGKCHPGANLSAKFKQVHLTYTEQQSPLLYWIKKIYIILIIVIIAGMLIHNILDFVRKYLEKKKYSKELKELKDKKKYYLRMTLNERVQHFIMLTSFIALVISGFALKYPDAWWVVPLRHLLGEAAFETRSITHRVFGILMILVSFYHFYYLGFTKRGKQLFLDFLPNLKDIKDTIINIKYLLGISKEKPQFGRFNYMEKVEYWALIWGVGVMSLTGLMLFFNTFFLSKLPIIFLDAATLIHLYEAWLATLSIVVWHFYFVIFNPEVFPLNNAFLTGVLSEEEMKHEHPIELEKLVNKSTQNNNSGSDTAADENINGSE